MFVLETNLPSSFTRNTLACFHEETSLMTSAVYPFVPLSIHPSLHTYLMALKQLTNLKKNYQKYRALKYD